MAARPSWIFKLVVAGAGGVGKTALIERYTKDRFVEDHKMTIGSAFSIKDLVLDTGETVRLQLWDFAGEERFRFILEDYCKGAGGALVCFDVTDYDTFRELPEWIRLIRKGADPNVPIALVGTKWDLPDHEVDLDTAIQYAETANCVASAVFCSSKLNINVEPIFHAISKWMIWHALNK
ncbi:MAG: hypothetical protein Kow0069_01120 [Promethearchaeota archaeon]